MASPDYKQMRDNMVTGKGKDLGKLRVKSDAIPKQSNITTRFGDGKTNDKNGGKKFDIAKKMKNAMEKLGMLENI